LRRSLDEKAYAESCAIELFIVLILTVTFVAPISRATSANGNAESIA
jgi:hypothetical protein